MLKSLKLIPVYDSSEYDLVKDLIVPLLENSNLYLRGVGFFTSGWLRLAAQGLTVLIENGGTARIVLSPMLEKADWEALQSGEKARNNEVLKNALNKNIQDITASLENDTLNALAWMVADEILDFRFAVAREGFAGGDYHNKVAVFTDMHGDTVAIHGSFNDSIKGSLNGEAFSVFKSWELGQKPFVDQHQRKLIELCEGRNRQFAVYEIPEAVRHDLVKLRSTSNRPYRLPSQPQHEVEVANTPRCPINLYSYQNSALQKWISADFRGIFEMATGTGKTFTALACAADRYQTIGKLSLLILVPYLHLIDQWKADCEKFGFKPILCSSNHGNWHLDVKHTIEDFNVGAIGQICILAVHDTASTDRFLRVASKLKTESTMIIGDEVHGLGASVMRNALIHNANMRLGLSATPKRWFDEEGTQAIFEYFNSVCFEFSLEEAIGKYLTPYEYNPELVTLTRDEMIQYEDLTQKISSLSRMRDEKPEIEDRLKRLLLERASLVASAEQKLERLLEILNTLMQTAKENNQNLSHILIYCAPGSHKEILRAVADLGLRCHEFVHTVSLSDRQRILRQFAKGDIQVIVAIKCLDEGVDVPATKIAFLLASTSNPREFVQRRGRVLRLADGKDKAILYDFIVTPRSELVSQKREVDASLLKRELPRFAEFSSCAMNEFDARDKLWDLLNHYEMLNLFDERPWDIYHKLMKDSDSMLSMA